MKNIAVLGSTGSIGRQTLDVVRAHPELFRIIGLAAGRNLELLKEQVEEFKPDFVSCIEAVPFSGSVGISLEEMAALDEVDTVVIATSGIAGLLPVLAAVRRGKNIALANKESLVAAGEVIMGEAKRTGAQIHPVDSEHSAIWQCLNGETGRPVRIFLTASGGPFRGWTKEQLADVKPEQALNHPSWQMGRKITIDSATLMNKGLELIEARWLFDVDYKNIEVLVHPQSIIHSMVEYADGSVIAQLSNPDMRLPIQYALTWPDRLPVPEQQCLDWRNTGKLEFEQPDTDVFPCLALAREAGMKGGICPAVLCAADEVAVELFLDGKIGFNDIPGLIKQTLDAFKNMDSPGIDEIMEADRKARELTEKLASGHVK